MSEVVMVKVSELILDYNLYPRQEIQSFHVKQMIETLEAGHSLPPIKADRKSKRVVDGFHRYRAYQRFYGKDAEIPTIFKTYRNEAEMFLEAMMLNSAHGRTLTPFDRARCIARAEELKMEPKMVAKALNMTPERLSELKASRLASYKMKPTMLKRTIAHLAGEELTDEQSSYNIKAGGMNQTFYINQIIALIEADAVDWENEKVVNALKRLLGLLDEALKTVKV